MIVYRATLGYSREKTESRNKWLCTKIGRIQVPADVVSDRAFLLEYLTGFTWNVSTST